MISASSSLLSHTPFFTCAVAMQAIVHLGIYGLAEWDHKRSLSEQQIKVSIGTLRKFSEVWEMADTVLKDVKSVARALHNAPRGSEVPQNNRENVASPPPAMDQTLIESSANLTSFDTLLQANDDSWIDAFLGPDMVR